MPAVGVDPEPRAVGPAGSGSGTARGLQVAAAGALVAVVGLLGTLWGPKIALAAEGGAPAGGAPPCSPTRRHGRGCRPPRRRRTPASCPTLAVPARTDRRRSFPSCSGRAAARDSAR